MTMPLAVANRWATRRIQRPGHTPPLRWVPHRRLYIDPSGAAYDVSVDDLLADDWEVVA